MVPIAGTKRADWVVATETVWPTKVEIPTPWPFTEDVCWPLTEGRSRFLAFQCRLVPVVRVPATGPRGNSGSQAFPGNCVLKLECRPSPSPPISPLLSSEGPGYLLLWHAGSPDWLWLQPCLSPLLSICLHLRLRLFLEIGSIIHPSLKILLVRALHRTAN